MIKKIGRHLYNFFIYLSLCAFVVTCCFLLFFQGMEFQEEQISAAAKYTFVNVLFLALLFTVLDSVRRWFTVDRPVKIIKEGLDEITNGDFSVRLNVKGSQANFVEIMERINKMTEELSGVETLRTDFIANVSHELKTPLAVMKNYGTLLKSPDLSDDKRMEYAQAITDSAEKLADLITNILKLNKLENQQIYPMNEKFSLSENLTQCLLGFENIWEEKNITIEADIEENVEISGDPELLGVVWNNLFSNAFKFTEPGGTVYAGLKTEGEFAVVTVSDTGCGMSAETGKHIFDKFYQGDTSHAGQGNGLGLALVKRIIDVIHGQIEVESVLGQGTTFNVKIRKN